MDGEGERAPGEVAGDCSELTASVVPFCASVTSLVFVFLNFLFLFAAVNSVAMFCAAHRPRNVTAPFS